MPHFLSRKGSKAKVRHVRSIIQFIKGSMQERDWASRAKRAYAVDIDRAERRQDAEDDAKAAAELAARAEVTP